MIHRRGMFASGINSGQTTVLRHFGNWTLFKIEQAMLELNFFMVVDSDPPEIRREFTALRDHTHNHVQRIRDEIIADQH